MEKLLRVDFASLLIIEERVSREFVVGVPHHAPAGVKCLPCLEHRESDENAGYLGAYIAGKLNCCSIIACNYKFDSNKSIETDYFKQIVKWHPRFLIEVHGHGEQGQKPILRFLQARALITNTLLGWKSYLRIDVPNTKV